MKHEKESENIEKAKEAVGSYCFRQQRPGDSSYREAPSPYFSQDLNTTQTAPPQSMLSNPYSEQYARSHEQQTAYYKV
ncbi:MAG: hypothetical protein ACR5KV_04655 [Wolbachia sp.]